MLQSQPDIWSMITSSRVVLSLKASSCRVHIVADGAAEQFCTVALDFDQLSVHLTNY